MSVRDLDDDVARALRVRAAQHGRSMEAEVRVILTAAVDERAGTGLFTTLLDRLEEIGGVELDVPERSTGPRAADFTAP